MTFPQLPGKPCKSFITRISVVRRWSLFRDSWRQQFLWRAQKVMTALLSWKQCRRKLLRRRGCQSKDTFLQWTSVGRSLRLITQTFLSFTITQKQQNITICSWSMLETMLDTFHEKLGIKTNPSNATSNSNPGLATSSKHSNTFTTSESSTMTSNLKTSSFARKGVIHSKIKNFSIQSYRTLWKTSQKI